MQQRQLTADFTTASSLPPVIKISPTIPYLLTSFAPQEIQERTISVEREYNERLESRRLCRVPTIGQDQ